MCWPMNEPSLESISTGPSRYTWEFGSSRRPLEANVNSTPMPPSMSTIESTRVAPVRGGDLVEFLAHPVQHPGERLEHEGALVEGEGAQRVLAHGAAVVHH